jgi:hypothetical protein
LKARQAAQAQLGCLAHKVQLGLQALLGTMEPLEALGRQVLVRQELPELLVDRVLQAQRELLAQLAFKDQLVLRV